jgi:hypothetical protein
MKASVRFYTIDQNSQRLYSAEASDMLQAIVYFRVAKETGERNEKGVPIMEPLVEPIMAVEISQPGGTSYTQDPLEVSQPYVLPNGIKGEWKKYKGAWNHNGFSEAVERFVQETLPPLHGQSAGNLFEHEPQIYGFEIDGFEPGSYDLGST